MTSLTRTISFGTKAETLARLAPVLEHGRVLPQVRFTVADWARRRQPLADEVLAALPAARWVVRSSARREDAEDRSLAGHFRSCLGVEGRDALVRAIDDVAASMDDGAGSPDDQVFVQPMLEGTRLSGVAFTRDLATHGHYLVVNYDDQSGLTDTVTSGRVNELRTYYHDRSCEEPMREPLSGLGPVLRELEALFGTDALDVEFAVDAQGVVVLQVRRIAGLDPNCIDLATHADAVRRIEEKVRTVRRPHPYLQGSETVLGVMPDWNPAEMIGIRPRPLALSLYKELITDSTWAYQRSNYGYRNVRSFPLLLDLAGLPYIDVRVSFNSFVPATLDDGLAGRLVNDYIRCLRANPAHHDKVEFEIIYSAYTLDLPERLKRLHASGFRPAECQVVAEHLRALTNRIIDGEVGLWKQDIARIHELEARQRILAKSGLDPLAHLYWLLEDCKRFGTLPFAGLARAGFIAVQMLRSLEAVGILTAAERDRFMRSLDTVSSRMSRDLAELTRAAFLHKYGHLRPGTYDILSPRYDEAPETYFDGSEPRASGEAEEPFALSLAQLNALRRHLAEHQLGHDPISLFNFIKDAIEGREYAKFVFTRSLSEALRLLAAVGAGHGLTREDMAFADVDLVRRLYASAEDPKGAIERAIEDGRRRYAIATRLTLPPLLAEPGDVRRFELPVSEPTYVTLKSVTGPVVSETTDTSRLRGSVLMIPSADPGYDWIFSHGIGGFITMYGGANSHMAIRASELGIPAVIGAGEVLFRHWACASRVELDCTQRQVRVLQ